MNTPVVAHEVSSIEYRCPGESHAIDRAVHLGRLAAFYPSCRRCVHRHDRGLLSPLQVRQWDEVEARMCDEPRFTAEALESASPNGIDRSVARRFVAALGAMLWQGGGTDAAPRVVVGADGHWTTAELVAVVCEALQWAGCRALEAGAVTSASLVAAAVGAQADAAMYLGNCGGQWHTSGLKSWGPGGRPWSSPGALDELAVLYEAKVDRPKRRGGGLERLDALEGYLAPLADLFHALRPLRFVLDTRSETLLRYLERLNASSACEPVRPARSMCSVEGTDDAGDQFVVRRLEVVARQVLSCDAAFGLWIDGEGAACHLVDERGRVVDGQRLCLLLAAYVCRQRPTATLVIEREASDELEQALLRLGARVVRGGSTREAMSESLASTVAVFGGGGSGEFWYADQTIAPDALLTLSLLLTILSQSDRPLSEVLDAA